MTPDIEVSRDIAASPADVFAALTDITRMGEWSIETIAAEWNEGFDAPAVGATFTGHNKAGDAEWSTNATIVELVENERFFFDCDLNGFHFSSWGYVIEPTDAGCRVTEQSQNLIPEELRAGSAGISGIEDRDARNRETMTATLERLAAALEG
ncbi:MAG: SRPBCC family protein [Acidimicrobiales bacterium]|nr:SRPBCC family protein [Acidimicrobiales bacterium]